MSAKTPAQRKAAERTRRKLAGQVLVQEYVQAVDVERLKKYATRLRKAATHSVKS